MVWASLWLPCFLFFSRGLSARSVSAWGATWLDHAAAYSGSVEVVDNQGAAEDAVFVVELDDWVP